MRALTIEGFEVAVTVDEEWTWAAPRTAEGAAHFGVHSLARTSPSFRQRRAAHAEEIRAEALRVYGEAPASVGWHFDGYMAD